MKDFITKYGERIVHSYVYIIVVALLPFIGWWIKSLAFAYYSLSAMLIITLILSKDFKALIIFVPFGMTCFREFFYFHNIPKELLSITICLIITIVGMIVKNIIANHKVKIQYGLIGRTVILIGIITFLAGVVRHIFYNEPAFIEYTESYNVLYGYLGGLAFIFFGILCLLVKTFSSNDYQDTYEKTFYIFAIYLIAQCFIVLVNNDMDISKIYHKLGKDYIGWCDKNTLSIAIQVTLPFLAYRYSKNYLRFDNLLLMGIGILLVLMSDSRGGQISVALLTFALIFVIIKPSKHYLIKFGILIIASVISFFILYNNIPRLKESIDRLIELGSNVTGRDVFWKWIIEYTYTESKHVLFGGSTSYLFELYAKFNNTTKVIGIWLCHNTFMTALAMGGTLGLIAVILHYGEAIIGAFKCTGDKNWMILSLIFFGLVHGMIDNTFFNPMYTIPHIFILSSYNKDFIFLPKWNRKKISDIA